MLKAIAVGAALLAGGCVVTADVAPVAREGGSHVCEIKPMGMSERVRLASGLTVGEVRLPEIPFLPILRFAERPPGDVSGVSWTPLPAAGLERPIGFCGYINLARTGPGGPAEGAMLTQTGVRAPRGIAYDRAALRFLVEAFEAGQFFELPEGVYLAIEAGDDGEVDVPTALSVAAKRAEIDPGRWAITLSRREIYVPILGGGSAPWASALPPARGIAAAAAEPVLAAGAAPENLNRPLVAALGREPVGTGGPGAFASFVGGLFAGRAPEIDAIEPERR